MKCYHATGILFTKYNQSVLTRNSSLPASQHFLLTDLQKRKKTTEKILINHSPQRRASHHPAGNEAGLGVPGHPRIRVTEREEAAGGGKQPRFHKSQARRPSSLVLAKGFTSLLWTWECVVAKRKIIFSWGPPVPWHEALFNQITC